MFSAGGQECRAGEDRRRAGELHPAEPLVQQQRRQGHRGAG